MSYNGIDEVRRQNYLSKTLRMRSTRWGKRRLGKNELGNREVLSIYPSPFALLQQTT